MIGHGRKWVNRMRLIDMILKETGELVSEEYIMQLACPSNYGPEYDGYEEECYNHTCRECWEQEVNADGE